MHGKYHMLRMKRKEERGALGDVRLVVWLDYYLRSYGRNKLGVWLDRRSGEPSNGFNLENDVIRFIL